jgi:glycolate oxidase subunit GlcD
MFAVCWRNLCGSSWTPTFQTGSSVAAADSLTSLTRIVGRDGVRTAGIARYLVDEAQTSGIHGHADAVVFPRSTADVAAVMRRCYADGVPITPRGGGTGYAGGAVPQGGIVLSLERLNRIEAFEPLLWRIRVQAGVVTAALRELARANGLLFPPDPGAAESSQIGGNVATNAGGPHAFKYGVTGRWVTGIEAVVPPGEIVQVGGPLRKDAAGYDLKGLLIGSEGTLAVITSVWLSLIPTPEAAYPIVASFQTADEGCAAIEAILGTGLQPAAIEFFDEHVIAASSARFPGDEPLAGFVVIAEADGNQLDALRVRDELADVLEQSATLIRTPEGREIEALWRWRESISGAVTAIRGGKLSEDIAVPLDRLRDAITRTREIGARHGLSACSWGHAGDGNLHSTFLIDPTLEEERSTAEAAASELFTMAIELGGSISGEHGIGVLKSGQLRHQWPAAAIRLHEAIKDTFDPKGLLNPGKKAP